MKMVKKKISIDQEKELNEPKLVQIPEQPTQSIEPEPEKQFVLKGFYISPEQHDALTRLVGKLQSEGRTREDGNLLDRSAVIREAIKDVFVKYSS